MAVTQAEAFPFGDELQPAHLRIGERVLALEVYYKPQPGSDHPSVTIGQRELNGTVTAVPPADSDRGYVHLKLEAEPDALGPIQVIGIARSEAMYKRELVESQTHFYSADQA